MGLIEIGNKLDSKEQAEDALSEIVISEVMVDELVSNRLITDEAREYALGLIGPKRNWKFWTSRSLLFWGTALLLSGIICFFAFNWMKIPPMLKLTCIQLTVLTCLISSYYSGLHGMLGKILLLSASVLTGVFLAVFGQIYQTGANSYNLFMMWAILILPFVLIGEFSGLWAIWLVIANIFIVLYFDQSIPYSIHIIVMENYYKFALGLCIVLFNSAFLALREDVAAKGIQWPDHRWTRIALVVPVIFYSALLIINFIFSRSAEPMQIFIILCTILFALVHAVCYLIYRYKLPDMWVLTTIILSVCLILETLVVRLTSNVDRLDRLSTLVIISCATLTIFTLAIKILLTIAREIHKVSKVKNVS